MKKTVSIKGVETQTLTLPLPQFQIELIIQIYQSRNVKNVEEGEYCQRPSWILTVESNCDREEKHRQY